MASKTFSSSWVAIYRGRNGYYHSSNTPMRIGGFNDDVSFIGIPASVREALNSTVGTPILKIRFYITDSGSGLNIGGHSQTYNKAGGSTPAITNYGGNHSAPVGWKTITLPAGLVADMKSGSKHGVVLYGGALYMLAHGKTNNSSQVSFIVEGDWNTPPEAPSKFNNPVASTVADTTVNLNWEAGTDANTAQSALTYELGYYNGSSWSEYWTVGAGVTSYDYPLSDKGETSQARFSVRSIDTSGAKSGWTYSPYFRVSHNRAPNQPYNLVPKGGERFDRTETLRVSWKTDDDGVQAGYQVGYRTVATNGDLGAWVYFPDATNFANATREYHDYAPNTFALGEYEWTVRTKDQQGLTSPWSVRERIRAGEASTAPLFLNPTASSPVNTSELTVRWSSLDQERYEIELVQGGTVLWSESRIAGNKAVLAGYSLTNNTQYTVRLRIMSRTNGLWSDWAEEVFTTAFTPPVAPVLVVTSTDETGKSLDNIILSWTTDDSLPPVPTYVEVFRREYDIMNEKPWIKLAGNQTINGSIVDYTPASQLSYEYKVRVWADNETFSDSEVIGATIQLERSFLQRASIPSDLLVIDAESREEEFDFDGDFMKFSGRTKAVYESGVFEERAVPISFSVDTVEEYRNAVAFLKRRETLLYRDTVGRKFFGVARKIKVVDKVVSGFEFSITIEEVGYTEGEVSS